MEDDQWSDTQIDIVQSGVEPEMETSEPHEPAGVHVEAETTSVESETTTVDNETKIIIENSETEIMSEDSEPETSISSVQDIVYSLDIPVEDDLQTVSDTLEGMDKDMDMETEKKVESTRTVDPCYVSQFQGCKGPVDFDKMLGEVFMGYMDRPVAQAVVRHVTGSFEGAEVQQRLDHFQSLVVQAATMSSQPYIDFANTVNEINRTFAAVVALSEGVAHFHTGNEFDEKVQQMSMSTEFRNANRDWKNKLASFATQSNTFRLSLFRSTFSSSSATPWSWWRPLSKSFFPEDDVVSDTDGSDGAVQPENWSDGQESEDPPSPSHIDGEGATSETAPEQSSDGESSEDELVVPDEAVDISDLADVSSLSESEGAVYDQETIDSEFAVDNDSVSSGRESVEPDPSESNTEEHDNLSERISMSTGESMHDGDSDSDDNSSDSSIEPWERAHRQKHVEDSDGSDSESGDEGGWKFNIDGRTWNVLTVSMSISMLVLFVWVMARNLPKAFARPNK